VTGPVIEVADPATGELVSLPGLPALPFARPLGLDLPPSLTWEQWSAYGATLRTAQRSIMWLLGDWARYGEARWGQTYTQVAEETGRSPGVLRNAKYVAERFADLSRRRDDLDWSDHAEVASLRPDVADELLEKAAREELSTRELRAEVARRKGRNADISRDIERWLAEGERLAAAVGGGAVFVALPDAATIDAVADLLAVVDPRRRLVA
jgi:hypothetical protein